MFNRKRERSDPAVGTSDRGGSAASATPAGSNRVTPRGVLRPRTDLNSSDALHKRPPTAAGSPHVRSRTAAPAPGSHRSSEANSSASSSRGVGSPADSTAASRARVAERSHRQPIPANRGARVNHARKPPPPPPSPSSSAAADAAAAAAAPPEKPPSAEDQVWIAKTALEEQHTRRVEARLRQRTEDREKTLSAIDTVLSEHEAEVAAVHGAMAAADVTHVQALDALQLREDACRGRQQRALARAEQLYIDARNARARKEGVEEAVVVQQDVIEQLERELTAARENTRARRAALAELQAEETRMQDASYGLSGEVKQLVERMAGAQQRQRAAEVAAMTTELARRELCSQCEELKGSIRVYCRVRGRPAAPQPPSASLPATPPSSPSSHEASPTPADVVHGRLSGASASASADLADEATSSTAAARTKDTKDGGSLGASPASTAAASRPDEEGEQELFTYLPETSAEADVATPRCRTLCAHQIRANATSTGTQTTSERFTYDRVFNAAASQAEVYEDVEPLVNSAVDGYRVCVFAYGQTGSGKTYTMEGDVRSEAGFGIIPRALRTIFARQEALAEDGWSYELSCHFVEIYNDVVRDLQQSPALYEPGGAAYNNPQYHTIKQTPGGQTTITNVRQRPIRSFSDFQRLYRAAVHNRRTTRTNLNDRSSRSHCIFTFFLDGVNHTIRQRSAGVLSMVDLAGSERVTDSGVQGQQFKEAVNINRSLLDLGKCIHALRTGGVVPWRNSRLTYFLQNSLGAKGGKMLMLVCISDRRAHLAESLNSLRFATRVNQTVIGSSVKRVTNF